MEEHLPLHKRSYYGEMVMEKAEELRKEHRFASKKYGTFTVWNILWTVEWVELKTGPVVNSVKLYLSDIELMHVLTDSLCENIEAEIGKGIRK